MILNNLRVTVDEITPNLVTVVTDQGERLDLPRHLMPDASKGMELYIAVDQKPLMDANQRAKDILNEMIRKP